MDIVGYCLLELGFYLPKRNMNCNGLSGVDLDYKSFYLPKRNMNTF